MVFNMAYKAYLEVHEEDDIPLGDRIIYKTSWSIDKNPIDPKETIYNKKWDPMKISNAEVEVNIDIKKLFSVCGLSNKTELLLWSFGRVRVQITDILLTWIKRFQKMKAL